MGIQRFPEIENNSSGSTGGLQGTWNASTNTPALANTDTDKTGVMYQVSVGGTVNFGAGNITFEAKDIVVNNGVIWDKIDATDAVHSVNGNTGAVNLDADDIDDTSTTKKFTTATEKSKLSGIAENATANPNAFDKTADDLDDINEGTTNKAFTNTLKNKLDNIEANADVTDSTNVASAGAVMESDNTVSNMNFILYATGTISAVTAEYGTLETRSFTVTGAKVGDSVIMNFQNDSINGLTVGQPYVSSANTVSIDFGCGNETEEASSMGSQTYQIMVFRKTV